jgi:hypothetical protein
MNQMNQTVEAETGFPGVRSLMIGSEVILSITGMLGRHRAKLLRVNKHGQGHFEILDEPGWPILKPGDYILHEQRP